VHRPVLIWRALRALRPDLVLIKGQDLRAIIVSLMVAMMRVRRISWSNQTRAQDAAWRRLRRLGVMPRRHIRTVPERVGSLGTADAHGPDVHVPYAVEIPPDGRARPTGRGGPLRVLTVASYKRARKRPWWTLEAAQRAGLLDGDARLTFVGTGDDDDEGLVRLTEAARGLEHVSIERNVPFEQMSAIYADHDVLVLPSQGEPFGMVVLEAMAHGLAVVVGDDAGAKGCVLPGESGIVFDSRSLGSLADALRRLNDDHDLVDRFGARGRELARAHASPTACADSILQLAAT
jgi:glycosyltransferase involved in cell wall biosynthesis